MTVRELKVEEAEKSVFLKKQIFDEAEKKTDELLKEIENEKEKEIYDKIQIFLIKEIQKIIQNKKKDNPYRSR